MVPTGRPRASQGSVCLAGIGQQTGSNRRRRDPQRARQAVMDRDHRFRPVRPSHLTILTGFHDPQQPQPPAGISPCRSRRNKSPGARPAPGPCRSGRARPSPVTTVARLDAETGPAPLVVLEKVGCMALRAAKGCGGNCSSSSPLLAPSALCLIAWLSSDAPAAAAVQATSAATAIARSASFSRGSGAPW